MPGLSRPSTSLRDVDARHAVRLRWRRVRLAVALQRSRSVDIGLLQLDAPVAQLFEWNGAASHRAAHEVAGRQHLHLAVEIFQPGFALEANIAFEAVHQIRVRPVRISSFHHSDGRNAEASPLTTMSLLFVAAPRALRTRGSPCARRHRPARDMAIGELDGETLAGDARRLHGAVSALGGADEREAAREHVVIAEELEELVRASSRWRDRANMPGQRAPRARSRPREPLAPSAPPPPRDAA